MIVFIIFLVLLKIVLWTKVLYRESNSQGIYDSKLIDLRTFVYVKSLELGIPVPRLVLKDTNEAIAIAVYSLKKSSVEIEKRLLDNYSPREIRAVVLHELGHLKNKHSLKKIFFLEIPALLTSLSICLFIQELDLITILTIGLAFQYLWTYVFSKYLNHIHEFEADSITSRFNYHYDLISFLSKSLNECSEDFETITHPKYNKRIEKLEKIPYQIEFSL